MNILAEDDTNFRFIGSTETARERKKRSTWADVNVM